MDLLVTGGCGFIGSHYVRYMLEKYSDVRIFNLDALTYAAHPDTVQYLETLAPDRYKFLHADIATADVRGLIREHKIQAIVNFAAETHVDRSILNPLVFVRTNIQGVQNLLTAARESGNLRMVHVSTDEVYGTLGPTDPAFVETTPLDPNSPYAASKASADLLALSSHRTFQQDVTITRCSNNYGPFQFPEKLIPLVIANAVEDRPIPVYGDGKQVRDWIYVEDHCSAIDAVLRRGKAGQVYNISASSERYNIDVVKLILKQLGKPESLIQHVGDRPAHDRRYGLNCSFIQKELGWKPAYTFDKGLELTVKWYLDNAKWWQRVRDESYFKYYSANYDKKFVEKGAR